MTSVQTEVEDIVAWYYRAVAELGLTKTDCPGIFKVEKPMGGCVCVQVPDGAWTKDRAIEHIERIAAEIQRSEKRSS